MKVLHLLPSIGPERGGPTQVAINLVKSLRQTGVEVEIATTNDNEVTVLDVPLNQRVEYEQVPVWFFPRFPPQTKTFLFSTEITRWLYQHVREYDLIDIHYLFCYPSTFAAIVAQYYRVPYTMRTMGQLAPWALAQKRLKKQLYTNLVERRNLNQAAAIHCTSIAEAEDVSNCGIKAPKLVIPLGVNFPQSLPDAKPKLRHRYHISDQTPIVLFLSRLHYKKRPDLLIQALSQLAAQEKEFHLMIAGSGEPGYLAYLRSLVGSLGMNDKVTFTGFVMGQDKELLLQGSDLFVLPSYSENFGIAIAEAMSAGLPVIITPGVQIAPEIAEAKAGLVIEGNLNTLQNAIAQLLDSPSLRQQLGENGKRLVRQRYCWDSIAHQLVATYQAIIAGDPLLPGEVLEK
jgi:glycosyltransferase involved in cell wall biosynthesis